MQQEQSVVRQQVADNVTSIQGVFVTTAALMQDRTRASMALLEEQIRVRGGAEKGAPVSVGGKTVSDILIGGKGQAGDFAIVDYVTRLNKGTATIFSKDGDRFVRIATNVMKDDGTRAVGTELNNTTQAYAELRSQRAFYGVVDILGNPYFTAYEPLLGKNGESIGIAYVGYKAELPVLSQALEQAHLLNSGFVAVVDSNKARYLPSWVTPDQVQQATDNKDGSWVINRLPLSEWGLTIVSAYPAAELRAEGRKIGYGVALAGVILGAVISLTLFFLLDRKVLHLLGGEPRLAATYMKRIADGDLAVDIAVAGERPDSLMASLKVMQLKLKNLVLAVRGGAAEVSEQSHKFEAAFATFQSDRKEASSQEMVRQAKGISRTLALLEKSVGRFRL
jgi:methyl-accepting chemotaxis protein